MEVLMKRIVPIFILALLTLPPDALAQKNEGFGYQRRARKETVYRHIVNNETESYLYDEDGTFQYLGEVGQSGDGKVFPAGKGLSRTVEPRPETGAAGILYRFGPWERGARNGVFLAKRADGSYRTEIWKWDRLKRSSDEADAGTVARMEEMITRIELLRSITAPGN